MLLLMRPMGPHAWRSLRAAARTQPRPVAVVGVEAFEVEIEVHAGWGNADAIAVVGLPDTAVKESKDPDEATTRTPP
jgi:hypothetical protein